MGYQDDPEGYRLRLEAKLKPNRIRATLGFAGLYQMTHEMIKRAVVDDVAGFYGRVEVFNRARDAKPVYWWINDDDTAYRTSVLALSRGGAFKASLLWLVDCEAITKAQADRLDAIYDHRHDLTHELHRYIIDVDFEPEFELFSDAVAILKDLQRFWLTVGKDTGTFDEFGDIDLDNVISGPLGDS